MTNSIHEQIAQLEKKRLVLTQQMLAIHTMTKGKISEQFYCKKTTMGEMSKQGPYYVLSCWKDGRSQSRRIPRDKIEFTHKALGNFERFEALCQQFARFTEQLGELERQNTDDTAPLKKTMK